jgi:DnaJ family protein C protein 19
MSRLIILAAILAIALIVWQKISRATGEQRKKLIMMTIIWSIIGILVLLAATGKLNVITAVIAGAVAMLPRLLGMLKYLPLVERFYKQAKPGQQSKQQTGQQNTSRQNNAMSKEEALAILGLKPDATREDILAAHKRMIQKLHPDRGGSDHLASQINRAKETLLG